MAEKIKKQEIPLEYYETESNYVSPAEVSSEALEKIKQRKIRLGRMAILASRQQ